MNFNDKVRQILNYIGIIGAIMLSIAYILIVFILIKGFKVQTNIQTLVFAIINGAIGLLITNFLKYQGTSFARVIPENEVILKAYYATKTKDKRNHSLTYFWFTTVCSDIIFKGLTIVGCTSCVVYLVVVGSNDWNLLLLSLVNLLLFFCFGILALNKAYDYYNQTYMAYLKERIEESKLISKELESDIKS